MVMIGLLVMAILVGIPAIALIALARSRAAERRVEENAHRMLDLHGDLVSLRRDLAKLSGRISQLETPAAAPHTEEPKTDREPAPFAINVTPADEAKATPVPLRGESEATPAPAASLQGSGPATSNVLLQPEKGIGEQPASGAQPAVQPRPITPQPTAISESARTGAVAKGKPRTRRPGTLQWLKANLPLEEFLGMNLFAKAGIVLLVLGFALLGRVALVAVGPAGKVTLLGAVSVALLGGGVRLERNERYRLPGRAAIGGGWALLFFTVFAMWHVPTMRVMSSLTLNCVLLLIVAAALIVHTLRYRSQVVTGLAFLLAFSTVALGYDTVYALSAGLVLAAGIVVVCLKMGWYELEIFGILATFFNHFYWLWKLYPQGLQGHTFPQFWASCIILILYWLTFRISYMARGIRSPRDERLSTVAALLNTTLLLAVLRFQSTRPELAFYALLVLGALEFIFGQLPVTRRRRPAFVVLTVLGILLMLASVPFRFSGNHISLLWMIAAEALLAAGIVQAEVIFRRIALVTGVSTGMLILWKALPILELRATSEAPLIRNGVLFLACATFFWINGHVIARRWKPLFQKLDDRLAIAQSYFGWLAAFVGTWALFTRDWTALVWAVLMVAVAWASRQLDNRHLLLQAWFFAGAAILRAALVNCHFDSMYPHHLAVRMLTLPLLAALFYLGAAAAGSQQVRQQLRAVMLWCGSGLLIALTWAEVAPAWVALLWIVLATVLVLAAKGLRLANLSYQEHVIAVLVAVQLLLVNLSLPESLARYLPFLVSAAVLYSISRLCTARDAIYRTRAAWAHTWLATGLLAALAWHEAPQPWLAVFWAGFALALVIVDRRFKVEELPWQAHALALFAVVRAVAVNFSLAQRWYGIDLRWLTVGAVILILYMLAWLVRLPESWRKLNCQHAYTWAASVLAAWLLWCELQTNAVAVGIAILGLVLFEWGMFRHIRPLRLQAYAALTASFARIFFVNLTASRMPGDVVSPAVFTVLPITIICFYIWWRLQDTEDATDRWPIRSLFAWYGTISFAALLYFQAVPTWVVCWWSALSVALLGAALWLRQEVFLPQAILLISGAFARGFLHDIFGGNYLIAHGWRGSFGILSLSSALLLAGLPLAFRLRSRLAQQSMRSGLEHGLGVHRPEQWFFFVPVLLLVFLIAIRMNPGMVTLSWGIEGALIILLGLMIKERSYRLTGLLLLLVCVGKIVCLDAWRLHPRDRYITFIVLGAALTAVSMLYNRYREALRRLL